MPHQETLMHVIKLIEILKKTKSQYRQKKNQRGSGILAFFDFKAAFDKVDHETLLKKLKPLLQEKTFNLLLWYLNQLRIQVGKYYIF